MTLPEYIRSIGVKAFAARFDVTERAVLEWLYAQRCPRRETAQRIVSGSNGGITWEGIYAPRKS